MAKTTLKREAYEDNTGGLFVVDRVNKIIAWGAEYSLNNIDDNNDIKACLLGSLYDWTSWANETENSEGCKNEEGQLLTYDDHEKWLNAANCIAEIDGDKITLYPDKMGNNAKKWARLANMD